MAQETLSILIPDLATSQTVKVILKRCSTCGLEKPLSEFNKVKKGSNALASECKSCNSARNKAWRAAHPEVNARRRAKRATDGEAIREKERAYWHEHKQEKIACNKKWREANPDWIKAHNKEYYASHKEENSARCKAWREKNKDSVKQKKSKYYQENKEQIKVKIDSNPLERWTTETVSSHKILHLRASILELAKKTEFCPICRCQLKYGKGRHENHSATLDRVNNDESGRYSNIEDFWIICWLCNATKRDRSWQEFLTYCHKVLESPGPNKSVSMMK